MGVWREMWREMWREWWREWWRELWRENYALIATNTQHSGSNPDRYGFFFIFLWREK